MRAKKAGPSEVTVGARVRARGLIWEVVEQTPSRTCVRCTSGDLAGLEWDLIPPFDRIEAVRTVLDPNAAGPLRPWRLLHTARVLDQILGPETPLSGEPGRIEIEPYQLVPLMRALELPRPRLLLADGVGLGKTVQAGLIAVELIIRRGAHRILVAAPAGALLTQWDRELRHRFGLRFTRVTDAASLRALRQGAELGGNPFNAAALCLTSLDFAKQEHVLDSLERTSWDLAIIDEAHHCAAAAPGISQESTLRRRLAETIARRADGLLLLTATPHDGHDSHFASLIELLDPSLVDGLGGLAGQAYRRHVVRRLKSHIRDPATGAPLFRERRVTPVRVEVQSDAAARFHRALSALVIPRLRRQKGGAVANRRVADALAFVSLLKRSVSTIAACTATLRVVAKHHATAVDADGAGRERVRALRAYRRRVQRFGVLDPASEDDIARLEAEEIAEGLRDDADTAGRLSELIELGDQAAGEDPKLEGLVTEVRLIRLAHPDANILIYTEYRDSQDAAEAVLRAARGIAGDILTIGGDDPEPVRAQAAERFGDVTRLILIGTDSVAEGLNLHTHCFHLIHLDLPYNPNRLEQRNGRIDRYGQTHDPEIRYLYLANTFEEHLLLRLIGKYEKARSVLTFMPDTLGVTADDDVLENVRGTGLIAGFAEEQISLFAADEPVIHTLDRMADSAGTDAFRDLSREIDRAYDGFEQMAVRHGWLAARGMNADSGQLAAAVRSRRRMPRAIDLGEFVKAVLDDEDGGRVPAAWSAELEGLPGYDTAARTICFTRERNHNRNGAGRSLAFPGLAHPLVRRAIIHASRLEHDDNARVSAARAGRGEPLGLLLTYTVEQPAAGRIVSRHIIAVHLPRTGAPIEMADPSEWIRYADQDRSVPASGIWRRRFQDWVPARRSEADAVAATLAVRLHAAWANSAGTARVQARAALDEWVRRRATAICGTEMAPLSDLFAKAGDDPGWRSLIAPEARLAAFAMDGANPAASRREANSVAALYQRTALGLGSDALAPPAMARPLGLLMLVPAA